METPTQGSRPTMSKTTRFDIATIGHFAIDLIKSPTIARSRPTLGGPAAFVSLTAAKLGAKVTAISRVGRDFHNYHGRLCENNVNLSHVGVEETALTTSFVLTYRSGRRKIQLRNKAPQIGLSDLPHGLQVKIVHVAPVANEVDMDVIAELRKRTRVLSIDPQGFVRQFDSAGRTRLEKPADLEFLQHCDVVKSSLQETRVLTGQSTLAASVQEIRRWGVKTVLITMGERGAVACFEDGCYNIPACKPRILVDSTGAGDAFIGGFLAEHARDREPLWCCCVGSAAASFVVEAVGSTRFGSKDEVYGRATEIYEKGIKPFSRRTVSE